MRNTWSVRPIWFMCHQRNRHGRLTLCIVPSSTSLRIPKDKDRRTIEQGEDWLCLKDVSRGEQNHSNESHRDDGTRTAICLRGFFGTHRTNPCMFIFVHELLHFQSFGRRLPAIRPLVFGQPSSGKI